MPRSRVPMGCSVPGSSAPVGEKGRASRSSVPRSSVPVGEEARWQMEREGRPGGREVEAQ